MRVPERLKRWPAWGTAGVLAAVYLLLEPQTGDHAAAIYRAGLFEREGFTAFDPQWYGGVNVPAYSVLMPPLAALVGPRILAAACAVIATALFERLTTNRLATNWFALGMFALLITGRVPFILGVAIGTGALVALKNRRVAAVVVLAIATALASPVAALFLALCAAAVAVCDPRRADAYAGIAAALGPVAVLNIAYPQPGSFPFEPSAFWPQLAATIAALAYFTRFDVRRIRARPLHAGIALYALLLAAAFAVPNAVGGNAARLGALAAGPALALLLAPRRYKALALVALPALYWQLSAPVDNYLRTIDDPSVRASYYAEIERRLSDRSAGRVEIAATENHWEAAYVAPRFAIARGWLRQVDRDRNPLFYEPGLTAGKYRRWLDSKRISHVALPDAPLDYSAKAEAAIVTRGVPGLAPVWRGRHWTLYEVRPLPRGFTDF